MQKNHYRIHFISGELNGRSFVIPPDGLLIGKSRAAAIRPGSSEIKVEHAMLQIRSDLLFLVPKAETVFVGDRQLEPGIEFLLEPGTDVRLGKDLSFLVEKDEGLPADEAGGEEEETVDEATADSSGPAAADEHKSGHTRYASSMELQDLRTVAQRKIRQRKLLMSLCIILFLALVFGGFLYNEFYFENPVTWPGELKGNYHDGEFRINLSPAGKFLIYFPRCKQTRIKESKDKTRCDVLTLLGKNLDVPFHLQLTVNTIREGYITPRKTSFERWQKQAEKNGFTFTSMPEQDFYSLDTTGYPYYKLKYKRVDNKFQWQGMASYLRYHNREIIFLREVPLHHYWRSERVLTRFNCFVVSPDARYSYWEIPDHVSLKKSNIAIYKGLLEIMWSHLVTSNWQDVKAQFAELLSSAYHQKDAGMAKDALLLWQEFRKRQHFWYSQKCLAYQQCKLNKDMNGMIRIRNACLRKFPDASDCRHNRIIKNIWDIEL